MWISRKIIFIVFLLVSSKYGWSQKTIVLHVGKVENQKIAATQSSLWQALENCENFVLISNPVESIKCEIILPENAVIAPTIFHHSNTKYGRPDKFIYGYGLSLPYHSIFIRGRGSIIMSDNNYHGFNFLNVIGNVSIRISDLNLIGFEDNQNVGILSFQNIHRLEVANVHCSNNFIHNGGCITCNECQYIMITQSSFQHNIGNNYGNGITIINSSHIDIQHSLFLSNNHNRKIQTESNGFSEGSSGTLFITGSHDIKLYNLTFDSNLAVDNGGGLFLSSNTNISIINNSFHRNQAMLYGGGIFIQNTSHLVIENTSFIENIASFGGGLAIESLNNNISVTNCIFFENYGNKLGSNIFLNKYNTEISIQDSVLKPSLNTNERVIIPTHHSQLHQKPSFDEGLVEGILEVEGKLEVEDISGVNYFDDADHGVFIKDIHTNNLIGYQSNYDAVAAGDDKGLPHSYSDGITDNQREDNPPLIPPASAATKTKTATTTATSTTSASSVYHIARNLCLFTLFSMTGRPYEAQDIITRLDISPISDNPSLIWTVVMVFTTLTIIFLSIIFYQFSGYLLRFNKYHHKQLQQSTLGKEPVAYVCKPCIVVPDPDTTENSSSFPPDDSSYHRIKSFVGSYSESFLGASMDTIAAGNHMGSGGSGGDGGSSPVPSETDSTVSITASVFEQVLKSDVISSFALADEWDNHPKGNNNNNNNNNNNRNNNNNNEYNNNNKNNSYNDNNSSTLTELKTSLYEQLHSEKKKVGSKLRDFKESTVYSVVTEKDLQLHLFGQSDGTGEDEYTLTNSPSSSGSGSPRDFRSRNPSHMNRFERTDCDVSGGGSSRSGDSLSGSEHGNGRRLILNNFPRGQSIEHDMINHYVQHKRSNLFNSGFSMSDLKMFMRGSSYLDSNIDNTTNTNSTTTNNSDGNTSDNQGHRRVDDSSRVNKDIQTPNKSDKSSPRARSKPPFTTTRKSPEQARFIRNVLSENFIFTSISEEALDLVVDAMSVVLVEEGETVVKTGEPSDNFYVIARGKFVVVKDSSNMIKLNSGKSFGELALISSTPRLATVCALTSGCLYSLHRDAFRYILASVNVKRNAMITRSLSKVSLFSGLRPEQFQKLADAVEIVKYPPGQFIIRKGTAGDVFYIIQEGKVKITDIGTASQYGDHELEPGSFFGEKALLTGEPRSANVIAITEVSVLALNSQSFNSILGPLRDVIEFNTVLMKLGNIELFVDIDEKTRIKLVSCLELESFPGGMHIFQEGDHGDKMYIIKEGTVRVMKDGQDMGSLASGQYFGDSALIGDEIRKATIISETACSLYSLSRDLFLGITNKVPDQDRFSPLHCHSWMDRLTPPRRSKTDFATKPSVVKASSQKNPPPAAVTTSTQSSTSLSAPSSLKKGRSASVNKVSLQMKSERIEKRLSKSGVSRNIRLNSPSNQKMTVTVDKKRSPLRASLSSLTTQTTPSSRLKFSPSSSPRGSPRKLLSKNIKLKDLTEIGLLGCGTFGRVSLVQHIYDKKVYALKAMLKSEIVSSKQIGNIISEKSILAQSNHPFILKLFTTFKDERFVYMLLEVVQGGELFSIIHTSMFDGIPVNHARFYGSCIAQALAYLHSKDIAYRDMKPENCLIDQKGYPKLVDFGFAKKIDGKTYTLCGTAEYLAPEIVLGRGHDKAVDYWAFGVLLYEMVIGYSPFCDKSGMDQEVIFKNIIDGRLHPFPRNFEGHCQDLVLKLLRADVGQRLGNLKGGARDVLHHSFLIPDLECLYRKTIPAPWIPSIRSLSDTRYFRGSQDVRRNIGPIIDCSTWEHEFG